VASCPSCCGRALRLGAAVKFQPLQSWQQLHPWRLDFPLLICSSLMVSPFLTCCCCFMLFFFSNKGPLLQQIRG
jgi:hypothetical protein